jgi:hypothetical protein
MMRSRLKLDSIAAVSLFYRARILDASLIICSAHGQLVLLMATLFIKLLSHHAACSARCGLSVLQASGWLPYAVFVAASYLEKIVVAFAGDSCISQVASMRQKQAFSIALRGEWHGALRPVFFTSPELEAHGKVSGCQLDGGLKN